ncbi:long-chain-fatty-acid--CoA ligase [Neobacillus niacini]|uniref:long-chain-fatty-acid--CoA ligase n=1 Tax=Neobacillus niacini TaxID=86668 RepID=UPI002040BC4E|nr:long-chain fatty acid--CoA ligase [Neobacillus niacini]MCM3691087.1 long-chain fatty acid--CoA ligase [Neobacillus niacini]
MTTRPWHFYYENGVPHELDLPLLSLYDLLETATNAYPSNIALVDKDKQLTYEELKNSVDFFAGALHYRSFNKGDRVALMLPNCIEYIIAFYAVQRLGGIVVQVNPQYKSFELEHILADANPKWFIHNKDQKEKLDKINGTERLNLIVVDDERENSMQTYINERRGELPALSINPMKDIAILQYTGGTTGKSKGVMLSHFNIVGNIHQSLAFFSDNIKKSEECFLGIAPMTHALAVVNMNFSILLAAKHVILEKFDKTKVLEAIRLYRPTMFFGTPTMYIGILHHPDLKEGDLSSLKICASGSAPMPVEVIKELEIKAGAKITEGYGLSEATNATHRTPVGGLRKVGSIGVPIPNTDAKIVDLATGNTEMPVGQPGELIINGPQVMQGYLNNSEETHNVLRNGWLYTGDIAVQDEDGYFYIVGRKKDMIVSGGFNIYPSEVEEVLYQHPAVMEAVVFGVPDSYLGEKVKAVVVLNNLSRKTTVEELLEFCNDKLARYKVPRLMEFRESLPKTYVGKILRRTLKEEYMKEVQQENR